MDILLQIYSASVSLIHHMQEFMESEGIVLNDPEPMPCVSRGKNPRPSYTTPSEFDNKQQFLTMDRKVKEIPSIQKLPGSSLPTLIDSY